MMGALADAAMAAGGEVTGVIPRQIVDLEVGHTGVCATCGSSTRCTSARR